LSYFIFPAFLLILTMLLPRILIAAFPARDALPCGPRTRRHPIVRLRPPMSTHRHIMTPVARYRQAPRRTRARGVAVRRPRNTNAEQSCLRHRSPSVPRSLKSDVRRLRCACPPCALLRSSRARPLRRRVYTDSALGLRGQVRVRPSSWMRQRQRAVSCER
jgi:hypothetical protein